MSAFLIPERYRTLAAEDPSLSLARVVSQEKGLYRLLTESGEETATISGHLRYEAASASDLPAVGDYVMVQSEGGSAVIRRHEEDLMLLEVPAEELYDVDTVQALEKLEREVPE